MLIFPFEARNAWAKEICERGWGIDTLARIYLRKTLGRAFTKAELDKELSLKRKYSISPEEVSQAFLRGEEVSTCIVKMALLSLKY